VAIHNASSNDPVYQGNPSHHTARKNYYGVNAYPTVMVDGLYDAWPLSTIPGYYSTRMAVPCHLDISVAADGSSSPTEGTLTFTLTTDNGLDTPAAIHAMINESGIPGTGTYSGTFFNYGLRWNLFSADGTAVSFGSSPETIVLEVDYAIDSSWDWDELYLTTFVQIDANREILNSHMVKMSDLLSTGIEEVVPTEPDPILSVGSNPSRGAVHFTATVSGGSGTVSLFSLDGRLLETMPAGTGTFTPERSGMYFLRLDTPCGSSETRPVVVLK